MLSDWPCPKVRMGDRPPRATPAPRAFRKLRRVNALNTRNLLEEYQWKSNPLDSWGASTTSFTPNVFDECHKNAARCTSSPVRFKRSYAISLSAVCQASGFSASWIILLKDKIQSR